MLTETDTKIIAKMCTKLDMKDAVYNSDRMKHVCSILDAIPISHPGSPEWQEAWERYQHQEAPINVAPVVTYVPKTKTTGRRGLFW